MRCLLCAVLLFVPFEAALAEVSLGVEAHTALFSGAQQQPLVDPSMGWGVRLGLGARDGWGAFLQVEQNVWIPTQSLTPFPGVLNAGVGVEHRFAGGLIRSSLAVGTSTLLFDTALDQVGDTGLYVDVRPLGLRWSPIRMLVIGFDPLSLVVAAPVMTGLPLVRIQYRTSLSTEVRF